MKYRFLILFAVVALLVACGKEKPERIVMNGRMENVTDADPNAPNTKTYITNDERWVCWESTDQVLICPRDNRQSDAINGDDDVVFDVAGGIGTTTSLLTADIIKEAHANIFKNPIYLFSPHTLNPTKSSSGWTITLPATQPYRTTTTPDPDHTFSSQVMPMVAFSNGVQEPYQYFHPVCGILRLQFYSSSATEVIVDKIVFKAKDPTTGDDKQISGVFKVTTNNSLETPAIQDPEPFITPNGIAQTTDNTITITDINKPMGGSHQNSLYAFYLALPYTKDPTRNSDNPEDFLDNYKLSVTVKAHRADDASVKLKCAKVLTCKIHRCNLTKMRALDLEGFVSDDAAGPGTSSVQLVGDGSKDRPFQIYTYDDLLKVRTAFDDAKGNPMVNGQAVKGINEAGGPTYFKICRSDIVIPADGVWTGNGGIKNFKGYMYFESSTANQGIIENNSNRALFESISPYGKVEGISLAGSVTVRARDIYSPFCQENNGIMLNCHNYCDVTVDVYNSGSHKMYLAGLCAENRGTIIGGANSGDMRSDSSNVAGICYYNYGTIQGSFTISHATPKGKNIAGICFENMGGAIVKECIVSSSVNPINSSGNAGIIVFKNNSNATISDCRVAGSLMFTANGSLGGICNTNYGTVKNCSNTVTLVGCNTSVGGIVAINEAGEVYNCDSEGDHEIRGSNGTNTATYAGGIVGWLKGGSINNCFNQCLVTLAINSGGIVGKIEMPAWRPSVERPVQNCWSGYGINLHGYVYDTICKVGNTCFSAAMSDFDTLSGCNRFHESLYHLTGILPSYANYVRDQCSSCPVELNMPLKDALNYWVDFVNPYNGSKYWRWTVNDDEYMPRFDMPAPAKRLRAQAASYGTSSAVKGIIRGTRSHVGGSHVSGSHTNGLISNKLRNLRRN